MISKFRIRTADIQNCAASVLLSYSLQLHPTIAAQQHFVLLYSDRNAHIFCQKSTYVDWQVDHVYSSQSVD